MKPAVGLLAALLIVGPSLSFFKYERRLQPASAGGQQYAVVDEPIWQHARNDLSDLRLYSADKEIPYKLEVEWGSSETEQREVRVLQPAILGGKTEFLLDVSAIPEYDRVELKLGTKNFVAHASVEGQDDPHGSRWAKLGTTTLYDLSQEKLGHNSTLQIPRATFKYLRVSIDNAVQPSDVEGANVGITRAQEAVWREIGSGPRQTQEGKDTILTFSIPQNVPLERVEFEIDPAQPNFQRAVEIQAGAGQWAGSGEISRVHMQRNGRRIDTEQNSLHLRGTMQGTLRAVIHNGDDPPLKIPGAQLYQYERRIYFDSLSGAEYRLYYGDVKLEAPVYDYAKFYQKDESASRLQLGAEEANTAYTGRPDERPWSERHPIVLWIAILAAVLILGGIAVKSMRAASP